MKPREPKPPRAASDAAASLAMSTEKRAPIAVATYVEVLFRDRWLCSLCHRPTILPLAMKYLELFVREKGIRLPLAYYDFHYRRDAAPLLDQLACVIDHVTPHAHGGTAASENLAVACNKCNARKSSTEKAAHLAKHPAKRIRGRYGEPTQWDGLASVFIAIGREKAHQLTPRERVWLRELEKRIGDGAS